MIKRLTAAVLLVCLLCSLMTGCGKKKEELPLEELYRIVLIDLGEGAALAGTPHIHEAKYKNEDCYAFYITVGDEDLAYMVSKTGEILAKEHGSHSH